MADIELVIKIPEEVYNAVIHKEFKHLELDAIFVVDEMGKAIANGRLIDESKIKKCGWNFINHHAKTDAPTILEADKG